MPPVAAAVGAGLLSSLTITAAGTIAFNFTLASFLTKTAISLVLGYAQSALAPKPKGASTGNFGAQAQGITQTVRQPVTTRKRVYGQTRVGGSLVFASMTNDNKYLHMVIAMNDGQSKSIDEVWVSDYAVPNDALDANGNVISGRFNGYLRLRKHLGEDNQLADTALVAEVPEWTTNHRMRGITYLYVRAQYNIDKFPGGVPNYSAFMCGSSVFDPRTAASKFSTNAVLFQRDYVCDPVIGFNASARIDESSAIAAANIADEYVTTANQDYTVSSVAAATDIFTLQGALLELMIGDKVNILTTGTAPGGTATGTDYYVIPYQFKDTARIKLATSLDNALAGTAVNVTSAGTGVHTIRKIAEPRYHGAGVLDTENNLDDNMKELLTASGGRAVYSGGKWTLVAAAYSSPTLELDDSDILEVVTVRTALQRRDTFNSIKGVYRSPLNLDQPSDWPALVSNTFIADDGGEQIWREMDTPYTPRPQTSRRIAKIELLKARQPITCRIVVSMKRGIRAQCAKTLKLTRPRMGWNEKVFEVTNFGLVPREYNGNPTIAVQLDLRETSSTDYDWSTSEEQAVDPAPNTTLPNAYDVSAPTAVAFNSRPVSTVDADTIFVMALQWAPHQNQFVLEGGQFNIEYKKSSDADYLPYPPLKGSATAADVFQGSVGDLYDIRIQAENNLGVKSSWVTLLNVSVGSGGGVTDTENWGSFTGALDGLPYDWQDFATPHSSSEDWGTYAA